MANTMRRTAGTAALALIVGLFIAALGLAAMPSPAHAVTSDPYKYTVRVWGGNQGTVSGGTGSGEKTEFTVSLGEEISLSSKVKVNIKNDKYYVKGFRIGGQDNMDGFKDNVVVNEDMDFVVAYGVKGSLVSYTVKFVEYGTGKALTSDAGTTSRTYYGNKGDKPVVAYDYIDGYRPRYRNITGTLGAEGSNNWTLEYIKLEQPAATTTTTTTTQQPAAQQQTTQQPATQQPAANQNANANQNQNANANANQPAANDQNANAGNDQNANAGNDQNANQNQNAPAANDQAEPPATEEIIDNDQNPLAQDADQQPGTEPNATDNAQDEGGIPSAAIVGIVIAALALIGGVIATVLARRRNNQF